MERGGYQEPGEGAGASEDAQELLWAMRKEKGGKKIRALTKPSQGRWFSLSTQTFSTVKCYSCF